MFDSSGEMTPWTQKITFAFRQPRWDGSRRLLVARWSSHDRDGMANDDRLVADQNLLHQQADDALPFEAVQLGERTPLVPFDVGANDPAHAPNCCSFEAVPMVPL